MKLTLVLIAGLLLLASGCNRTNQPAIQADLSTKVTDGAIIEAVEVRGHIAHSIDTMRNGLRSGPGVRISLPVIRSDIQFLYSLGFEDVRVEDFPGVRMGRVVVFRVKEKAVPSQKATP